MTRRKGRVLGRQQSRCVVLALERLDTSQSTENPPPLRQDFAKPLTAMKGIKKELSLTQLFSFLEI